MIAVPMRVSVSDPEVSVGLGAEYRARTVVPLPPGGQPGDLLAKNNGDGCGAEWITPADAPEQDNTRPITAAAVYTEIGNINALLATI